ncbi:MAG: 2-oxoacid:ferredoxin oxidoreductase subunit beta [Candidatus Heimdallarchaeota archaeon]|nr:2-oxoacid:ferredoxin oxidoreductase subunit beta [Candidatus Heimdallarchaeota archaeon]
MTFIDFGKLHHNFETSITAKMFPTIWCSGCSLGTNLQSIIRGAEMAGYDFDHNLVMVSGIGCTGRASGYVNIDGFHTTHGRAIPFSTGVKQGNPDLEVIVFSGDGDLFSIGGNHFIHAARRQCDMTVICNNNSTYGLTGGQASATSFVDTKTPTTISQNADPFNLVDLALGAGAAYVARYTSAHFNKLPKVIAEALKVDGFAFIDLISGCPAIYGKRNGYPNGPYMNKMFEEASIEIDTTKAENLLPEATRIEFDPRVGYTRIPVGVFRRPGGNK